jgi:glycosyltransferase involved in cell wall biosynthesis
MNNINNLANNSKFNIVISVPDLDKQGGVSSFYNAVLPYIDKDKFDITVLEIGSTNNHQKLLTPIVDQFTFKNAVSAPPALVHINPSLGLKSFIRDGFFTLLAKRKGVPVIIFFHGWNKQFEQTLKKYFRWFFNLSFARADTFIVLATEFKIFLQELGVQVPIYVETTAINESLVKNFNIDDKINALSTATTFRILFLARLEREKGVFETIDAIKLLAQKGLDISLSIAGDGPILEELKSHAKKHNLTKDQLQFLGHINGEDKIRAFTEHHLYCFPTNYGEGLPTSVLEAMVFGLPVITRPVGGLADHFKTNLMGKFCQTMNPEEIAQAMESIISNKEDMTRIARYNHQHAIEMFMASKVADRLSTIYSSVLKA